MVALSRGTKAAATLPAEKQSVAFGSVVAACFLTAAKLIVGVLTGSLGMLSEAAHSGLDLVATVVTYLSVRASGRPADQTHQFGHGKVENLSAFVETTLLLLTSAWIVLEAVRRLVFHDVHVDPSPWAFGVLLLSIIVNAGRARALSQVAKKYNSQALEADALHFSIDIYSSIAVIVGLVLIYIGRRTQQTWPEYADPLAALVVAGISVYIGTRLGNRSVGALRDAAPEGASERIAEMVSRIPGVLQVDRTRVRQSGDKLFVDLQLTLESNIPFEHAQSVADTVKSRIRESYPTADIVVDAVPHLPSATDLAERVRSVAHRGNFQVHDVSVVEVRGRVTANLDVEVDPALGLVEAHERATALESLIKGELPEIQDVNVHIEPLRRNVVAAEVAASEQADMEKTLLAIVQDTPGVVDCHSLEAHRLRDDVLVTVHCTLQPGLSVEQAHDITEEMELRLRQASSRITQVNIHAEPKGADDGA